MSSDEDGIPRFVSPDSQYYSNNTALKAYISSTHDAAYDESISTSDATSSDNGGGYSSIGSFHDKDSSETRRQSLNVFNPASPFIPRPSNRSSSHERDSLLGTETPDDAHARMLREKVMKNHRYYYSMLGPCHIWFLVLVTSLNHLLRKFYEYFAYFFALNIGLSFYSISWSVAALDFAAIFATSILLPFIITKSPHFVQFCCEIFMGMSMLLTVWWHTVEGLFMLRFIFGTGYVLILSNWSACIATFVSPSKQSSAIGRIDLSWSFASFFFILCAYIMDMYGFRYILYILSAMCILCSFILFSIMPSQKLIRSDIGPENLTSTLVSMLKLIFFQDVCTTVFLGVIGLIAFVNTTLTLLLAPWLSEDYGLSITEFGYCTVMIGTAQVVSMLFSYQFGHKLGVGWSLVAGILVQLIMFVLIALLNSRNGVLFDYLALESAAATGGADHYTFPLLFMLLILAIHFIAAEFTYINAVTCMLHIAPLHVISSKTAAANAMRFVTSVCRIGGALAAPYLWYSGSFWAYCVLLLAVAFSAHLALMLYITCCVWDRKREQDEYMMVSSKASSTTGGGSMYMFQDDKDYPNVCAGDDMDDEYLAKILSTDIDFTIM